LCGNFHPQIKINMKNLNLSESQLSELKGLYQSKLTDAQAAVEEVKNVISQINALLKDGGSVATTSVSSADAPAKRGPKPGAKRGPKAGAKRGPKPGAKRGPKAKVVAAATTDASTETAVAAPAKRGPKPGAKRGPKPGAKRGPKPGKKAAAKS
jgi:hypothetical protein